jgi:hypothetical protein
MNEDPLSLLGLKVNVPPFTNTIECNPDTIVTAGFPGTAQT